MDQGRACQQGQRAPSCAHRQPHRKCYDCYAHAVSRTIAHRELRNNSSAVLRAVQTGETIQVTNHGTVVAVLVPPASGGGADVAVVRGTRRGGFAGLPRTRLDQPVQEVLDDLRGER